jgi:hypothetical protein
MILFYDDWLKYPNAIVHESTKNSSFLRLAALYKKMGVKNHAFILALLNPELENIDPHDPNLTVEQMVAVGIECRMNPWYYLREALKVAPIAGSQLFNVKATRGLISTYWLYLNHIQNILIQPRQSGKTFTISSLLVYLLDIAGQNTTNILFTKDSSLRADMMDKIRDLEDTLPAYLKRRSNNDVSNTEEIKISALNNKLTGVISNASEKIALKAARGFTAPTFFIDEAAYIPNIAVALPAALAAGIAAMDTAALNNSPYGVIITTTAGKLDDKDGAYVYSLLQESLVWNENLFDCRDTKDLRYTIEKNNINGVCRVNSTFNHRQLGYTDEWLARKIKESISKGLDAERDFLNKWTNGSNVSPLEQHLLNKIKDSLIEPSYIEVTDKTYILNWYIPKESIEDELNYTPHVLGIDSSEASGSDNIALVLKSVINGKVVMTATVNETYILDFCVWLCNFIVNYKSVTTIIEKKSTGLVILEYLLKMLPNYNEDPYVRLFNRVINDRDEDIERFKQATQPLYRKDLSMLLSHKKHFGFSTSGSGITNRADLYSVTLKDNAIKTGQYVYSNKLINEIAGLVIRNGRVDHPIGGHDDLVVAWLLCHWFMTNAQNLNVYNIDSSKVLIENRFTNMNSDLDRYDIESDLKIKAQIDDLIEKIKNSDDENLSYIYEKQIRFLSTRIKSKEFLSTLSIDDFLNKIRDKKAMKNNTIKNNYQNSPEYGNTINNSSRFGYRPSYEATSYLWGTSRM